MPDVNPFSINPSLFIGIGTNGWRILQELRKLIFEEFGHGGLPCFRYIGIESDSGKRPDDSILPHVPEDYERVSTVYISIPDVNIIRRRLDPNSGKDHIPGLGEWLDLNLIERGSKSFDAGAGNSRQAGRMCLWENWASFKQSIARGLDAVRNPVNQERTDKFLRHEYFGKKRQGIQSPTDSLINSAPKVYIFGTLCGGTCSGTFIDIAYHVAKEMGLRTDVRRSVLRGVKDPELIGLFTISDRVKLFDANYRRTVVNCWAALKELDFYYHQEGRYWANLPDGSKVNTVNEPFDTVYIQSLNNLANTGFDRHDYDGLAQMCAMNLFTEVVAGLSARKSESRVNLCETAVGYLERNQSGNMRSLSSFGLSAFWYPKYRIAQAINRSLAIEMCEGWLGGDSNPSPIRDAAAKDWGTILAAGRASLIGAMPNAQCHVHLQTVIEQMFDQGSPEFMAADENDLEHAMVGFPQQSTFVSRLSGPTGDYFERVNNAEPFVAKDIKTALATAINGYFREHTCAETKEYVTSLVALVSETIEQIPTSLQVLSQQIDVSLAREVHQGWWTKSVGRHCDSIEEYRRSLWQTLKQRVINHLMQLRDYFLRQALGKVLADLANLQNQVAQAEARLRVFRGKCERELRELIDLKPAGNIVILAASDQNSVAEDVQMGARSVLKTVNRETLRTLFVGDTEPMQLLAGEGEKALSSRMDLTYSPYSQRVTAGFQIGEKAVGSRNRIPELVNRAAPYVEAVGSFKPLATKDTPNFLFCADEAARLKIVGEVNDKLKDDTYSPSDSTLDHFVIFYHEAVGLALSDLAICQDASQMLQDAEKDPSRNATNYTHRQGAKMFDPQSVRDAYSLTQWINSMKYLSPETFQTIEGNLCLEYKAANGLKTLLQVENLQALRDYLETRGSESLTKHFINELNKLGRSKVIERMETAWKSAPSLSEKETLTKAHEGILRFVD